MELFAADGHDAGGCERVTGKSGMRPSTSANRVKGYLDDARTRHANRLRQLRNAYEDDTWELIRTDVSPRSIVLSARQDAERELRRLESGCTSPVVLRRGFGLGAEIEPGCEDRGEQ